ncbi:protein-disulfide reductase DsbD domain-containing protein [Rhizobium sp. YIM 134829]|uniref:protein-disulfide reductase DsbD domain-containing protein n=1 Tax=Rhizobium sp. YIM 134829 TaxID=3390453 RepID=UPI00397813CB
METPGGSLRLILGAIQPDGTLPAILDIRLEPGWRTYWRTPGSSGIPPEVSVDEGPVKMTGLSLPAPRRFGEGVEEIIGYDRPVAFPLSLSGAQSGAEVRAEIFIGICKEICIPVSATMVATAGTQPTPLEQARIDAALRALPEPPSPDFRIEQTAYDPEQGVLSLALHLPEIRAAGPVELFLSGPDDQQFGRPVETGREGRTVRFAVALKGAPGGLPGSEAGPILITVRAAGRSMETPLAFD